MRDREIAAEAGADTGAGAAVVILAPIEDEVFKRLREGTPGMQFVHRSATHADLPDAVWRRAEVLYTDGLLPETGRVPRLRWVQLYSAGVDSFLNHPLLQGSITVTTTSGVHAIPIAESVFGALLTWSRRLDRSRSAQERRHWPSGEEKRSTLMPAELWGATIGIVGYGSIGRQVARVAAGFGMHILAVQRGEERRERGFRFEGVGDPDGELPERFYRIDELDRLLRESDVVVIALPLTPETQGLFGEKALRTMKRTALLINVARGSICDEGALVRALSEGWIAGAALDVFEREPLPAESPLWAMPNVFITPHSSGLSPRYAERAGRIFEENLRRFTGGAQLLNVVSREHRY